MAARDASLTPGASETWQWWTIVPIAAAAVSGWVGISAISAADRYLDSLSPRSIEGINRGLAGIRSTFGLVCLACGVGCLAVAWAVINRPTFDRRARSMVWGSAAFAAGFLPWLASPHSTTTPGGDRSGPPTLSIWALGLLSLAIGAFWSSDADFRQPRRTRWWHATPLPWAPAFAAFLATTAVAALR